ncbi:PREDICTED: proline-rich protein 15 [Bison bison bison]|uniref:Proline-rich protein 15 n=1 Tax=Bison bison bison TaxID=43346 RepID=A0A6P3G7N5_BISBB|nr:PREDICTED: proline-rich protein 15 [Bison bison bison]
MHQKQHREPGRQANGDAEGRQHPGGSRGSGAAWQWRPHFLLFLLLPRNKSLLKLDRQRAGSLTSIPALGWILTPRVQWRSTDFQTREKESGSGAAHTEPFSNQTSQGWRHKEARPLQDRTEESRAPTSRLTQAHALPTLPGKKVRSHGVQSLPECALGESWGGAGAKVSQLSRGLGGLWRRRSGSLSPSGLGRRVSNHKHRRSFALQRRRIPGASRAWDGKEPSGNLEMSRGASESYSFVELVRCRPNTESAGTRLRPGALLPRVILDRVGQLWASFTMGQTDRTGPFPSAALLIQKPWHPPLGGPRARTTALSWKPGSAKTVSRPEGGAREAKNKEAAGGAQPPAQPAPGEPAPPVQDWTSSSRENQHPSLLGGAGEPHKLDKLGGEKSGNSRRNLKISRSGRFKEKRKVRATLLPEGVRSSEEAIFPGDPHDDKQ